jgi:hypothetical protein
MASSGSVGSNEGHDSDAGQYQRQNRQRHCSSPERFLSVVAAIIESRNRPNHLRIHEPQPPPSPSAPGRADRRRTAPAPALARSQERFNRVWRISDPVARRAYALRPIAGIFHQQLS